MKTNDKGISLRNTARIVGSCYLISNFVFLFGAMAFVEPNITAPDYLSLMSENRGQVVLGVLLELTNAVAYLGIAVFMFPIMRQQNVSLALGYFGFRIIEFVMQILTDLSPLSLISLSEDYVAAGAPQASAYQTTGAMLISERYWAFQMLGIALVLGAFILYSMLYKQRLVPRFISVWGFLAAAGVLVSTVVDMAGGPLLEVGVFMLLNELFLGVWLVVKGFSENSTVTETSN